jgi:hypothetical protein
VSYVVTGAVGRDLWRAHLPAPARGLTPFHNMFAMNGIKLAKSRGKCAWTPCCVPRWSEGVTMDKNTYNRLPNRDLQHTRE